MIESHESTTPHIQVIGTLVQANLTEKGGLGEEYKNVFALGPTSGQRYRNTFSL